MTASRDEVVARLEAAVRRLLGELEAARQREKEAQERQRRALRRVEELLARLPED